MFRKIFAYVFILPLVGCAEDENLSERPKHHTSDEIFTESEKTKDAKTENLKTDNRKTVHERFVINDWFPKFPLKPDYNYYFKDVTSPFHICNNEQLRDAVKDQIKWGPSEPVDIFIMAEGEPRIPYITKIGGTPYRPADSPWPRCSNGEPMVFWGQVCFADSKDIVGDLLGDVLLVFQASPDLPDEFIQFEWHNIGIKNVLEARDVPVEVKQFAPLYGHIYRTKAYPEAKQLELFLEYEGKRVLGDIYLPVYLATQIGETPFLMPGSPELKGKIICTIHSAKPEPGVPFPLINRPAALSPEIKKSKIYTDEFAKEYYDYTDNLLTIADEGAIYIAIDDEGKLSYSIRW